MPPPGTHAPAARRGRCADRRRSRRRRRFAPPCPPRCPRRRRRLRAARRRPHRAQGCDANRSACRRGTGRRGSSPGAAIPGRRRTGPGWRAWDTAGLPPAGPGRRSADSGGGPGDWRRRTQACARRHAAAPRAGPGGRARGPAGAPRRRRRSATPAGLAAGALCATNRRATPGERSCANGRPGARAGLRACRRPVCESRAPRPVRGPASARGPAAPAPRGATGPAPAPPAPR